MSSVVTRPEYEELVRYVVATTSDFGLRPAGRLVGVSHTKIQEWRDFADGKAELADPTKSTVQKLRAYRSMAEEVESRRAGLLYAANRLEETARELRREANDPTQRLAAQAAEDHVAAANDARRSQAGARRRRKKGG